MKYTVVRVQEETSTIIAFQITISTIILENTISLLEKTSKVQVCTLEVWNCLYRLNLIVLLT